jgi:hypothetical protein
MLTTEGVPNKGGSIATLQANLSFFPFLYDEDGVLDVPRHVQQTAFS